MSFLQNLTGKRFGNLLVKERDAKSEDGNNVKYIVECKCGRLFSVHAFRLRDSSVMGCPVCRKVRIKNQQQRYRDERGYAGINFPCDKTKYTLMDPLKTKILMGSSGQYIFFSEKKARIAMRSIVVGACVVDADEADKLVACACGA